MDIAGAKALKKRLGSKSADHAPARPAELPEDAPPLYHWVGVRHKASETRPEDARGEQRAPAASLLRRLGLGFRQ